MSQQFGCVPESGLRYRPCGHVAFIGKCPAIEQLPGCWRLVSFVQPPQVHRCWLGKIKASGDDCRSTWRSRLIEQLKRLPKIRNAVPHAVIGGFIQVSGGGDGKRISWAVAAETLLQTGCRAQNGRRKLVPLPRRMVESANGKAACTPNAMTSNPMRPSAVGPHPLNAACWPSASTAPTVRMPSASAGA